MMPPRSPGRRLVGTAVAVAQGGGASRHSPSSAGFSAGELHPTHAL
jgi:hypothetical protein